MGDQSGSEQPTTHAVTEADQDHQQQPAGTVDQEDTPHSQSAGHIFNSIDDTNKGSSSSLPVEQVPNQQYKANPQQQQSAQQLPDEQAQSDQNQYGNPQGAGIQDQFFGGPVSKADPNDGNDQDINIQHPSTEAETSNAQTSPGLSGETSFGNAFFGHPTVASNTAQGGTLREPGNQQPSDQHLTESNSTPDQHFANAFFDEHLDISPPRPDDSQVSEAYSQLSPTHDMPIDESFSQQSVDSPSNVVPSQDSTQSHDTLEFPLPAQNPTISTNFGAVPVHLSPQNVVIGSQMFSRGIAPSSAVVNGQKFTWDSETFHGPSRSIPFPSVEHGSSAIIAGGEIFAIHPSNVQVGGETFQRPQDSEPSPLTLDGQVFYMNPSQLISPETNIPLPSKSEPTPFVYKGRTMSADSSYLFAGSTSILLSPSGIVSFNGEDLTIRSSEVIGPHTSVPLTPVPTFSAVRYGALTISVAPSEAIVGSIDIKNIQPGMTQVTTVINGQTLEIGPDGVEIGSTTIALPTPTPAFRVTTLGDVTLSLASTEAVINGQTYLVLPGSPTTSTVIDGRTLAIGPSGVHFEGTTVALPRSSAEQTAEAISIGTTDAVIDGTTYAIGNNAPEKTIVVGSETIKLGTEGVVLPEVTLGDGVVIPATTLSPNRTTSTASSGFITATSQGAGAQASPGPPTPGATAQGDSRSNSGLKAFREPYQLVLVGIHIGIRMVLHVLL